MSMSYGLPYDPRSVVDKVTHLLTEFALVEDWLGQLLFNKISSSGRLLPGPQTDDMRRFLHVQRVFETELRMRYKDRGYHGI